jgi:hypothetical protein
MILLGKVNTKKFYKKFVCYFFSLKAQSLSIFQVTRYASLVNKMEMTSDFPNIAASPKQLIEITLDGMCRSLVEVIDVCEIVQLPVVDFILPESTDLNDFAQDLKKHFDTAGSDKGSTHNYYELYAETIFRKTDLRIMEIGIGSNRVSMPSNMGIYGSPGASLKVWNSLPNVIEVIGLDLDKEILFDEEKIKTYHLDQTDRESWQRYKRERGEMKFDLIIDDGLHSPLANLVTISESLDLIKVGGHIMIEDIPPRSLPIWQIFLANKPGNIQAQIFKFRKAYLLKIRKLDDK